VIIELKDMPSHREPNNKEIKINLTIWIKMKLAKVRMRVEKIPREPQEARLKSPKI
jgi:hypothetical protein